METLWQDFRYGLRMLTKSLSSTGAAVLTLALGIGANTAIFSVVNAVLLRPLPYPDSQQLVLLWGNNPQLQAGFEALPVSAGDFVDWQRQNQVFEQIAAFRAWPFNLTSGGEPERIIGAQVSAGLFPVLGVTAAVGRTFLPEEDHPGQRQVVVVSHGLWHRRFGSDPNLVGKIMTLNSESYTIVGIMPPDFHFPRESDLPSGFQFPPQTELWTPLALTPVQRRDHRSRYLAVIGRFKPEVTQARAQGEMSAIARRLAEQNPIDNTGWGVKLVSLQDQIVGRIRFALFVLLGAVGFVLLIACANVANLQLARIAGRQKEMAIRTAIGASRFRVIRQILTESVLLSLLGGVWGTLLAFGGIKLLVALSSDSIPRVKEIDLDGWGLGFTLLLSCLTGITFGLAPALHVSQPSLNESLKDGSRQATADLSRNRVRSLLVISEVVFSLVLLIGAGLMIKSFVRVLRVDLGFDPRNVLSLEVSLPESKYTANHQVTAFYQQLLERLQTLPGVQSVGAISQLPLGGAEETNDFTIEGRPPAAPGEKPLADLRTVSADYFRAMSMPLLTGRSFSQEDLDTAAGVVIINHTMARRFWPNENPLGKRLTLIDPRARHWLSIVGVVADSRHSALEVEPRPQMYQPYFQSPALNMFLVVRSASDPKSLAAAVRSQVEAVDQDQPMAHLETMEQRLADSLARRRFSLLLLGILATVALILAAIGIYGMMSSYVAQRTHEIGIRVALGAQPSDVLKLVVAQGMTLTLIGLGLGLGTAFGLTRLMASLLYGISAADPAIFISTPLLLAGVALLACYLPARRATKVDPITALRHE